MDTLLRDMPRSSIPTRLGGDYEGINVPFHFDLSEGGPFHHAGSKVEDFIERVISRSVNPRLVRESEHYGKLLAIFQAAGLDGVDRNAGGEEVEEILSVLNRIGKEDSAAELGNAIRSQQPTSSQSVSCNERVAAGFSWCTIS